MDSRKTFSRHRNHAKSLETCGGQGRNRTADASLFRAALIHVPEELRFLLTLNISVQDPNFVGSVGGASLGSSSTLSAPIGAN
jgi:hypothetical protein